VEVTVGATRWAGPFRLAGTAPLIASAGMVAAALAGAVTVLSLGPLSLLMLLHIATMSLAAPLVAAALASASWRRVPPAAMPLAAILQLVLLWTLHAPPVVENGSLLLHAALQVALFAAAVVFWLAIAAATERASWSLVAALLVTGKLACLAGALLVFSPRRIYAVAGFCSSGQVSLDDQHLAGLLMITACPLSYLVAGVVAATRLIPDPDDESRGRAGCVHAR